jgi:hypothetical protein
MKWTPHHSAVAAVVILGALHFIDRPRSAVTPRTSDVANESTAVRNGSAVPHLRALPSRRLAIDCGDHELLGTGSTDRVGSFVVGAHAPLHGDVHVCTLVTPGDARYTCTVEPSSYTAVTGTGQVKIVGPRPGETVHYRCEPR